MGLKKIGIVGATGYVGVELLNLLDRHSDVEVSFLSSNNSLGEELFKKIQPYTNIKNQKFLPADLAKSNELDFIFFATQHNFSMDLVPDLIEKGTKVIDLSADFRISDTAMWEKAYEDKHRAPELAQKAVYGLPELGREKIKEAKLVAVPGCYPTASILGIIPVIDFVDNKSEIILDVKSGISGAGRNKVEEGLSSEIKDNFKAYSPEFHRHQTEINYFLKKNYGITQEIIFTPHLIPIFRGEYVTCYIKLKNQSQDFQKIYEDFYDGEKFVRVQEKGTVPELKKVQNTNFCDISVFQKKNVLTIHVAIDNLLKGAASQAMQCFNIMLGSDEEKGLDFK